MTRDEVVKLLAWRLGNRKDIGERIISEMRFVQSQVLEQNPWLPWFLEKDWEGATLTAGATAISLPADYLAEIEDEPLRLIASDGAVIELVKELPSDLAKTVSSGGGLSAYSVTPSQILFNTSADIPYALQWRYMGKAEDFAAADTETPWLAYASDLVMAALGEIIAGQHLFNATLAQGFAVNKQTAWNRLMAKDTSVREVNQQRSSGRVS